MVSWKRIWKNFYREKKQGREDVESVIPGVFLSGFVCTFHLASLWNISLM